MTQNPTCAWCGWRDATCMHGGKLSCAECPKSVAGVEYNPEPTLADRVYRVLRLKPGLTCAEVCEELGYVAVSDRGSVDEDDRRNYDNVSSLLSRHARSGNLRTEGPYPRQYFIVAEPTRKRSAEPPKRKRKGAVSTAKRTGRADPEWYRKAKEAGQCPDCRCEMEPEWRGHVYCPVCREIRNERYREYKAAKPKTEARRLRAAAKRRRARCLADGICYFCESPALEGHLRCADCTADVAEWQRETRERRRADGKCWCGGDPVEGRKNCQRCIDRMRARWARDREKHNAARRARRAAARKAA